MDGGAVDDSKKLNFWRDKTGRNLTAEDSRQIKENLTGFFDLLREWQLKEGGHVH